MRTSTDLTQLLKEEPFVRTLAGQLLADERDDVVQQVYLQALQNRPDALSRPRSWLARVVRNLATDMRRQERHRLEREHRAAVGESVPSAATLVEIEERRRALIGAVNELPTALRTLVLLRFYEGLPPRRIADRLGMPVAVVWERLRQALQRLRQRLDSAHGDDRRAWLLPLVPLAVRPHGLPWRELLSPPASPWTGGILMMTKNVASTLVVAVIVLLVAVWIASPGSDGPTPAATSSSTPSVSARLEPGAAEMTAPAQTRTEDRSVPSVERAKAGDLLVRVLFADEPRRAADVVVTLNRAGGDYRVDILQGRTDVRGEVRFDAVPVGAWEANTGHALQARPFHVVGGEVTEVVLNLNRGMTLTGVVVDNAGAPVPGALIEVGQPHLGGDPGVMTSTRADGTFEVRACPTICLVGARAAGYASSAMRSVHGANGETQHVRLEVAAPGGMVEGVVLCRDGEPVTAAVVRVGDGWTDHLMAPPAGAGGPPLPAQVRTDESGRFRAIGVPVGEQPVHVQAVGFAPWQGSCLVVANRAVPVRVVLTEGACCEGSVVTADSAPVAGANVRLGDQGDFVQRFARSDSDGRFTMADLPAGEIVLKAADDEHGETVARIHAVAGAVVRCQLRFVSVHDLHGRVVDDAGEPVANLDVRVSAEAGGERRVENERTNRDGRFVVPALTSGGLVSVRVSGGLIDTVRQTGIDPAAGEVLLRVRIAPRTATIRGLILDADGMPASNTNVEAFWEQAGDSATARTGVDGSFEIGPLRTGRWQLRVARTGCAHYQSVVTLNEHQTADVGTIRLHRGGTFLVKVVGAPAERLGFVIYDAKGELVQGLSATRGPLRSPPLHPGDYSLRLAGEGLAARSIPVKIRDEEETEVAVAVEPGIRQRIEFRVDEDQVPLGWFVFQVRRGDSVLLSGAASAADGFVVDRWFAPGDYEVLVSDGGLEGNARFTVERESGPPLIVQLR